MPSAVVEWMRARPAGTAAAGPRVMVAMGLTGLFVLAALLPATILALTNAAGTQPVAGPAGATDPVNQPRHIDTTSEPPRTQSVRFAISTAPGWNVATDARPLELDPMPTTNATTLRWTVDADGLARIATGPIAGRNDGERVYAFGDSITVATLGPLAPDGSDGYAIQMRDRHAAGWTTDRSSEGTGMSSRWAAAMVEAELAPEGNNVFVVAFGTNDRREDRGNLTAQATAANLAEIHRRAAATAQTVLVALPPLHDPSLGQWYSPLDEQHRWLAAIQAELELEGVRYVKTYDALDSTSYDGRPGEFVAAYAYDGLHPNQEGHRRIADYLWTFIAGSDHTRTQADDGRIHIAAHYNQTLTVTPQPDWACHAVLDDTTGHTLQLEWTRHGDLILRTLAGHEYTIGPC